MKKSKNEVGITLIALVIAILFSYDERIKYSIIAKVSSNNQFSNL